MKLWKSLFIIGFILWMGTTCVFAQEYVTVKKDGTGDYTGIQEAIDDPFRAYDEIVVYPGLYEENILIAGDITLRAYDGPYLTCIDGHYRVDRQDTVTINSDLMDVKIIGFHITRGNYGINLKTSSHVMIANCVVHDNDSHGIYTDWEEGTVPTEVEIYNNVMIQNGGNGLNVNSWRDASVDTEMYYLWIHNNVFMSNSGYGIYVREPGNTDGVDNTDRMIVDFNNFFNNTVANYGPRIGVGEEIEPGPNEISVNPRFVGQSGGCGLDVRLQSASQCRDKGDLAHAYEDIDGTRNDIGAYGGPYAATFYENPTDGPMVRDVTINPGSVHQGETFTIQATGAVR